MTNRSAPGCTNRSEDNKNISFHRLPSKSEEVKKKWLHNLKRKNIPETVFLCSEHFEPHCFKRDLRAELMGTKLRNELKDDAVPTLFQHSQCSSRKRISSIERVSMERFHKSFHGTDFLIIFKKKKKKKKERGNVSKYNLLDIDPEAVVQSFIKKETLALVFSCEFYEISKNTFFIEHLWTTAPVDR